VVDLATGKVVCQVGLRPIDLDPVASQLLLELLLEGYRRVEARNRASTSEHSATEGASPDAPGPLTPTRSVLRFPRPPT
jgi:hypothetical protein